MRQHAARPRLKAAAGLCAAGALSLCCAGPRAAPTASASGAAAAEETSALDAARLRAIVDAADRADADRAIDGGRKPAATLAFIGARPGWRVAELGAGGGYTTELLARSVAPGGVVYAQNPPAWLNGFLKESWPRRLARPAMANVVRVDRDFDAPLPPEATNLDAVVSNAAYHDTVNMKVDRAKMNAAVFAALKPGGEYVVIDSSAVDGHGLADTGTLHRIDEATVKAEVEQAGFRLGAESDFLRNPEDLRDWSSSPGFAGARRGTGDRFALKFIKPG